MTTTRQLSPGRYAWGGMRAELGLSIRELSQLSGVNRGKLSLTEAGRYLPTAEEWSQVLGALLDRAYERKGEEPRLRGGHRPGDVLLTGLRSGIEEGLRRGQ